uniref:Uncharacterized protein n=1 Tax=Amphimedon queenslandica TaxID=400682 RepID=A0A1X7SHI0_AMPQE
GRSALRANPSPEVTDPFCRLPLPTLFYRPEAANLGDLRRIEKEFSRRSFKDRRVVAEQAPAGAGFADKVDCSRSLSPAEPLPGSASAPQKEKLTLLDSPDGVSDLLCVAACAPPSGTGILTRFPFGPCIG